MALAAYVDRDRSSERRLLDDLETRAGTQSHLAQVAQDLRHLLGDARDRHARAGLDLRERNSLAHRFGEILGRDWMAVRTRLRVSERGDEPFFDAIGDRVL